MNGQGKRVSSADASALAREAVHRLRRPTPPNATPNGS
jgi:hypothetical protein